MQIIDIDLDRPGPYETIKAKQGDVGRTFAAQLWRGGQPYVPPAGAVWTCWYAGQAGEGNYSDHIAADGNMVTVPLITQMLAVDGRGNLCLICGGTDGSQLGAWNIPYDVEPVPGYGSDAAKDWYTGLSEKVGQVAESAQAAKASADSAAASAAAAKSELGTAVKSVNGITPDSAGAVTVARKYTISVPTTGWTAASGGGYDRAITVSGVTASSRLDILPIGQASTAAEQAAAQWEYLDTAAGKVTVHAPAVPTAAYVIYAQEVIA